MIKRVKLFISTDCLLTCALLPMQQMKPLMPSLAPVLKNIMPAIVNVAVQGYLPNDATPPGAAGNEEDTQDK